MKTKQKTIKNRLIENILGNLDINILQDDYDSCKKDLFRLSITILKRLCKESTKIRQTLLNK